MPDDPEHPARSRLWVRTSGPLPDDPQLHVAALAFISDLTLLSASTVPHDVLVGLDVQAASIDKSVTDHINFDRAIPGVAEVLSVRPSWTNSPEEVAAKREAREQADAAAQLGAVAPAVAGAALNLSKANQIASGALQ